MNDFNKTPNQVANDAQQVGKDAIDTAKGGASGSAQAGKNMADKASSVASDAKKVASDAVDTGRAYAKDAVNAAGKKIDSVKSQFDQSCEYVVQAINNEPVKAVLITAVVSSVLTALLASALRSNDRYY